MKATIAVLCFLVSVAYAFMAAAEETTTVERCYMEPETGPCKARYTKYYFDKTDLKCKEFTYGGCDGNENRFDTEEECRRACK
uniref:Putative salivary kunitz domain protein n=1 Tax=Ixodes ricinus TaxID=34613 RepID=A0A0K8R655_IXORI